jgi:predicted CXXCH cytochrome family protein
MKILPLVSVLICLILVSGTSHAEGTCSLYTCHPRLKGLKNLHKPVAEMLCLDCHKKTGNHPLGGKTTVSLKEKPPTLCFQCHKSFPVKKTVHRPVKEGLCTACHNPHGAAGRNLIDADNGQTEFCTRCHDARMFQKKYVHPPVAEGKCTACHEPHQSEENSLLRDGVPKLCLGCHPEVMKNLDKASVVHPPVKQGKCTGCHDPHSSSARYLLKGVPGQFCITCHVEIGKKVAASKIKHAPLETTDSCLSCHSGHTAEVKSLLPSAGKNFCLKCHTKMAASLNDKKMLHGPIRDGKCTPCHDPHGSPYMKLLKGAYPGEIYVPFDKDKNQYGLCLKCHEKNMLKFPDTTIYTKFRNGKENLHYFHVANKRKSRTCRLCHEPHGSNSNHLIRNEGAEFGIWNLPVGFKQTPNGGTCAPGCHGTYSYDRQLSSPDVKPVKDK